MKYVFFSHTNTILNEYVNNEVVYCLIVENNSIVNVSLNKMHGIKKKLK